MKAKVPNLINTQDLFIDSKEEILFQWLSYDSPQRF